MPGDCGCSTRRSRDVVLGVRGLRRTPGYTVAAAGLLVLALSATATTASLVSAYFLQPLPYPASDRLYHVQYAPPGPWEPAGLSASTGPRSAIWWSIRSRREATRCTSSRVTRDSVRRARCSSTTDSFAALVSAPPSADRSWTLISPSRLFRPCSSAGGSGRSDSGAIRPPWAGSSMPSSEAASVRFGDSGWQASCPTGSGSARTVATSSTCCCRCERPRARIASCCARASGPMWRPLD